MAVAAGLRSCKYLAEEKMGGRSNRAQATDGRTTRKPDWALVMMGEGESSHIQASGQSGIAAF